MEFRICRICLNNTASIYLFNEVDGLQYSTKIMRCVNVIIAEDDGLPNTICASCASELAVTYEFVQKCEASDSALRDLSVSSDFYIKLQPKEEECVKDEANQDIWSVGQFSDFFLDVDAGEEIVKEQTTKIDNRIKKKDVKNSKKREKNKKMGPLPCGICGMTTNSPSAMDIHMRTHTGEKPFLCKFCGSRHPSKGSLKRHIETHHSERERKFTCESCGSSFYTKNDIITHIRTHTDERPYTCTYCLRGFRQIASLIRHKRVHTREKPFPCPVCDKKFGDRSLVKKHLSVHSDERKFTCHICSKSVKTKNALNTHIALHSNQKQNICSFCGMAFAMKGNLKTHMRRVHSERSGQCSVCLKTFSDLEAHMRRHTGEKPFLCETCNQAFASKRSLAHHIVFKHENVDKFKCSIGECIKTFPTATMLEFHLLKQHTNHTPYICRHCSRGFFRNSDLSRHLRVSHMDFQIKIPMKSLISSSVV